MGIGEKGGSLAIKKREDCPNETLNHTISIFLRGSMGVGLGIYGSTEFKLHESGEINYDSILDRFRSEAGTAWGIYGASIELGIHADGSLIKFLT